MSTEPKQISSTEPDEEILPASGHGKMPIVLLLLWIANITFFFVYFIKFGWADLQTWLAK